VLFKKYIKRDVKMRNIMWACALLSGILSGSAFALQIVVGPYLQNPSETSMSVMWITDSKCTSWVEYGSGDTLEQKAFNSQHGLIDADETIHRISIDGLSPGKEYKYRVCSKEILKFEPYKVTYGDTITGKAHSFKTLSKGKESISFIVLNDIHQRDKLLTKLVKMSSSKPYDLVFLNGDILGHLEDEPQIMNHVLKPCSDIFAKNIPFVYVRGNHETRGKFARMLPSYLATPGGRYYYSFDHGSVHFIVMDGGEDKEDTHREYSGLVDFDRYRDEQKKWLEVEIQSESFKKATFRVVLVHMPTPSENRPGRNDLYGKWRPLFNQGNIDLMISGHTHSYRVVVPEKGVRDYPMVIGGSPKEGRATVIRVDATKDNLEVVMTRDDGEIVGTYEVKHSFKK
jgi:predicted phosphodiesterase